MSYGAFVKLEEGIEGLVHISEMCWTKRINHPSELVNIGDKIEVVVLGINKEKQEISLGMKQTQANPWDQVAGKYPPGTMVEGTVRNLTNYGAFIEIEEGIDGLLHISDMSWTRKIGHPNEVLEKGQRITCQVLNVDQERKRIALGLKQLKRRPVGDRHPRPLRARATWSRARSPSSPTSASSSSSSRASKACCTSPSWPTTRSTAPRRSSRSATRSRSRSSASIAASARSACRARRPTGPSPTRRKGRPREAKSPETAKETKELKGGLGGGGPLFSIGGGTSESSEE